MLAARRFAPYIAVFTLVLRLALETVAQPLLINPGFAGSPVEPGKPPTVADKRAENSEQLRLAMRKLETNGASDSASAQEVAYYQTRDTVLAQQDAVEQQIKDLESRKAELENQLKTSPASDKPYTFIDLDRLKDDLAAEQARANLVGDKLASAKTSLQKAQTAFDESEAKRRLAQAAYDKGKNGAQVSELAVAAERARQEAALAAETLALRKREVERGKLSQEAQRLSIQFRQDQVARISPLVVFSEADYQDQIDAIKKKEESATKSLSKAQASMHNADVELRDTQLQLAAPNCDRALLTERLEAQRLARERYSDDIDAQNQRLQQLAQLRVAWSQRYQIGSFNRDDADREVWAQWKLQQKKTRDVLDELAYDLRIQISKMREARSALTSVVKRADAAAKGPTEVLSWIQTQQKQLEDTLDIYEKNLIAIETSRRVHEKLLDEIGLGVEAITPKTLALGAWYQAEMVWKYRLASINGEPIQVGMATKGLTILVVGWMLSRFMAAVFAYRLLKRFRLSKDATSAIRSLVFYSMLIFVAMSALKTVNVDLTAFTILGGALAIGVGFGSQTLINNFIGGLIMLAERPVRLGERVTFGDLDGVVEDVGFRCTKLRTQADHLVTIPNSTLVNESIENIDRRRTIRRTINIAVTYNISRQLLATGVQALRDILEEKEIRERIHPIVGFEEFLPRVFFHDFAVESLNIQIVYWYAPVDSWAFMEHSERVNFRIMEEFDRLGIDFAFPSKTAYVKNQKKSSGGRPDSYAA